MIPLSKVRKYRKAWKPSRYEDLFKRYTDDDKAFRIYLPMATKTPRRPHTPIAIVRALAARGYEVFDYVKGLAIDTKTKKRQMKIGKVLKNDPTPLKKFTNDSKRAAGKREYVIVISRHPYDIAGMSTDRGWSSCMSLVDGEEKSYIMHDVKQGTIIAYLITNDDLNIQKPAARILIKPFSNDSGDVILAKEGTHGCGNSEFRKVVEKWIKEVNRNATSGVYSFSKKLYRDTLDDSITIISVEDKLLFKNIVKNPKLLKTANLTFEQVQMIIEDHPSMIKYLNKKIQTKLLRINGHLIHDIIDSTISQIIIAHKTYGDALDLIEFDDLTENQIVRLIKNNSEVVEIVKKPTEKMLIAAILADDFWLTSFGDFSESPLELAKRTLSDESWMKIIKKDPYLICSFNYTNRKERKLIDYAFFDSGFSEKKIMSIFHATDLYYSNEMSLPKNFFYKLVDKYPLMFAEIAELQLDVGLDWNKAPAKIQNSIIDTVLSMPLKKIYNNMTLHRTTSFNKIFDNHQIMPKKMYLKLFNINPGFFFEFHYRFDDDSLNVKDFSKSLVNKIVKFALDNPDKLSEYLYPEALMFLRKRILDAQWKKLFVKSEFDLQIDYDDLSPTVKFWLIKKRPKLYGELYQPRREIKVWMKKHHPDLMDGISREQYYNSLN